MSAGLTLEQVVEVVRGDVPSDALGDLLRRLPVKYYDAELGLYRPITPAILMVLDVLDECDDCDAQMADMVEFVAADPEPDSKLPAWTYTPGGGKLNIAALLTSVARRLAGLYSPKSRKRTTKTAA